MDFTTTLTMQSSLEAGQWLAVRQIVDGGATTIFLAEDYDDALLRIHLSRHTANVYRVHPPTEYGNLRQLLAQFRSQPRNRPKHLHVVLQNKPNWITEFRGQGIWEFKAGRVSISSWDTVVLKDFSAHHCHWGQSPTHAMISAWVESIGSYGYSPQIAWNRKEASQFTEIMHALNSAGLIFSRSHGLDEEIVSHLRYDSVLIAKFTHIAWSLVESYTTRAAASGILQKGLRLHLDGIRAMRPEVEALQFAAAYYQEQATWAASGLNQRNHRD